MEKLKEDYISIDTRLEYMEAIAVKYVPDHYCPVKKGNWSLK